MTYNPAQTQRDKVVTNDQNVQYTFMGVNLGWCDGELTTYALRKVKIVITQSTSGESTEFIITQKAYTASSSSSNPYYQWGRKDPILPGLDINVDKPCYSNSGYMFDKTGNGKVTLGTAIQHPNIFYNYGSAEPYRWYDPNKTVSGNTDFDNIWNSNETALSTANDKVVIKTIYDPSPVGYCMPASNVWSGTTYEGAWVTNVFANLTQVNSPYTSDSDVQTYNGWMFYCNKMLGLAHHDTSNGILFFPNSGYRDRATGNLVRMGNYLHIWSASSYFRVKGQSFGLHIVNYYDGADDPHIYPTSHNSQAFSAPVRPVREK